MSSFYWTARRTENKRVLEEKYFPTREGRDAFVENNPAWCKRGKICADNLELHTSPESYAFKKQLRELGVKEGGVLLVHSSMKSLGTTRMPEEVINDIIDVLGREGTLLFPALSYDNVTPESPVFDSRTTKPCIGLLPTVFFSMDGVRRSVHPTHSVCAMGKYAEEITGSHYKDETPVGPNSPYRLLPKYGGQILMLGDILRCCTFMHGMEEIANAPYALTKERIHYVVNGEDKYLFGHDFEGVEQRYDRIADVLTEPALKKGRVGKGPAYLIDAAALQEKAVELMKKDPYFFVDRI